MNDEEVLEYLEHIGVKGMRWGVRRQRSSVSDKKSRSGSKQPMSAKKKRAIRTAVGLGAGFVSARFFGSRTGSAPIALIGGLGTGLLADQAVGDILNRDGRIPASRLSD